jgi:hypothetical protein
MKGYPGQSGLSDPADATPDEHHRQLEEAARRGEFIGKRVGGEPANEADHFIICAVCGGLIDCRDLGQVFEHEGPLPHPAQDQPQ